MAIVINNVTKDNVIVNNSQIDKVYANNVLVWENWKSWSDSASTYKEGYPNPPMYATVATGSNIRVTYATAVGYKAYVEGEYGQVKIEAYYNGSWHELAKSDYGFSESSCSWSGDLVCEQIRANYSYNLARYEGCSIKASGLKKGS